MAAHLKKIHGIDNVLCFPDLLLQDLLDWLVSIGMEQHFLLFVREEMFLEECEGVKASDLERMGIEAQGHRIKILKACQKLAAKKKGDHISPDSKSRSRYGH
jgi:hypothetical protein